MNSNKLKQIVQACGTPVFAYSEPVLKDNTDRVKRAISDSGLDNRVNIYAAYFTNSNPHLFRILNEHGIGVVLQTAEEWHQLKRFNLEGIESVVSPSSLSDNDLDFFYWKRLIDKYFPAG